jgi:4-amino-4-deoxy-L-arabinose transferase-like glycosyltransferase
MERSENFAGEFFWRHHLMRFLKPYHHLRPWWFYVPVLLAELLPWTILLPIWLWRKVRVAGAERSEGPATQSATVALRYCAFAAGWCLLFFSVSACKLPTYLMPMLPLVAILLGHLVYQRRLERVWLGCTVVSGTALAGGLWWCIPNYAADASVGEPAARLTDAWDARSVPQVAYRDDWDAAAFYRGGRELPVISHENAAELIVFLRSESQALVLVRENGQHRSEELRRLLPPGLFVKEEVRASRVTGLLIAKRGREP